MKFRPFLLLVLVLAVIGSFSSCVKNYTCHCDIIYSGYPGLPDTVTKEYSISDVKSSAKNTCSNNSGTFDNNGVHTVENCYLY